MASSARADLAVWGRSSFCASASRRRSILLEARAGGLWFARMGWRDAMYTQFLDVTCENKRIFSFLSLSLSV